MRSPDWRDHAACIGKPVEWFDVGSEDTASTADQLEAGKNVCASCPVREQCYLESMLPWEEGGVFRREGGGTRGGRTEQERLTEHRRERYEKQTVGKEKVCPRLTEAEHQQRLALTNAGHSITEIAAAVGVEPSTIKGWRRRYGLRGVKPSMAQREERFAALYAVGRSDRQVARETGWTPDIVRLWRKRNGLPAQARREKASA